MYSFLRQRLFGLGKGICEGCAGLNRVLVFDANRFHGDPGLGLKLGFSVEPVGTSLIWRGWVRSLAEPFGGRGCGPGAFPVLGGTLPAFSIDRRWDRRCWRRR